MIEIEEHIHQFIKLYLMIMKLYCRDDPLRIIVYIEYEKYKNRIPDKISGFKVEVIVVGKVKALSLLQLEEVESPYTYSVVSRTTKINLHPHPKRRGFQL
jgi:hypothetical protein